MQEIGAPDRIRTCDLRLRRPTLYPLSYRRQPRSYRLTVCFRFRALKGHATGPDQVGTRSANTPRDRNSFEEEVAMYWGGGIIGLILLILLILLLTGNL